MPVDMSVQVAHMRTAEGMMSHKGGGHYAVEGRTAVGWVAEDVTDKKGDRVLQDPRVKGEEEVFHMEPAYMAVMDMLAVDKEADSLAAMKSKVDMCLVEDMDGSRQDKDLAVVRILAGAVADIQKPSFLEEVVEDLGYTWL